MPDAFDLRINKKRGHIAEMVDGAKQGTFGPKVECLQPSSTRDLGERQNSQFQVDVCVCTHNPDLGVLRLVFAALAAQTLKTKLFRVTLIDNASKPSIPNSIIAPLIARGVAVKMVHEANLGIAHARLRAAHETDADWICFVDDDNVITKNYLEAGLQYAAKNPHVGAFGGRLLLPLGLAPSREIKPFLPYLGIKDLGDVGLSGPSAEWCEWEPPTAGSFVSRAVLERFAEEIIRDEDVLCLGRKGPNSSVSCEDSFIMRGAYALGKSLAYVPDLVLFHHLRPHRLKRRYLLRLMYGYGTSHVLLERCLDPDLTIPAHYRDTRALRDTLWHVWKAESRRSLTFAIGMIGYHIAAYRAFRAAF